MGRPARFKDAIYAAAMRLFGERGLSDIGIREIAKAAGVSESALYRHWRSKNDLAREIFLGGMEQLHTELLATARPDVPAWVEVRAAVAVFFNAYDKHPEVVHYLLMNQHQIWRTIDRSKPNPVSYWFEMLRRRVGEFDLPDALNNDVLGPVTLGMILRPGIAAGYGSLKCPLSDNIDAVSMAICRVLGVPWQVNRGAAEPSTTTAVRNSGANAVSLPSAETHVVAARKTAPPARSKRPIREAAK